MQIPFADFAMQFQSFPLGVDIFSIPDKHAHEARQEKQLGIIRLFSASVFLINTESRRLSKHTFVRVEKRPSIIN